MVDAMIGDGDIVVMQHNSKPTTVSRAVWLKDKEATTLKRFYLEKGRVRLAACQPDDGSDLRRCEKTLKVQGKVGAVIRRPRLISSVSFLQDARTDDRRLAFPANLLPIEDIGFDRDSASIRSESIRNFRLTSIYQIEHLFDNTRNRTSVLLQPTNFLPTNAQKG